MDWQHQVNAVATEQGPDGRFVYRQVVLEVMRQQGKTVDLLALMVARALRRPRTQIAYTAQTRLDARHRLLDVWWPRIEASRLAPLVTPRRGSGSEALLFANGSMLGLVSGTQTSGHGDTLDLGVIDEAWAQDDDRLEQAMRPAMMTRDAQLWIVSTAGTEKSSYFRAKVDDGRARAELGATETGAYFGYAAADDADPADPATWRACMPALGVTVSEETVAQDFELMDLAEFRRAYLCQWPEVTNPGWTVIGRDVWQALADPASAAAGEVAFAVEVAPYRRMAAIATAGARGDGRVHAEVVDYRPDTAWVPARVAELARKWRPCAVVVDPGSHAGSLIDDLAQVGVQVVKPFGATDAAHAAGGFFDAVMQGDLAHRDQGSLNAALAGAKTRPVRDAWCWDRRAEGADISPLVACSLAWWGYTRFGRSKTPPYDILRSVT
jgi:phage terminase large subunit-like protein